VTPGSHWRGQLWGTEACPSLTSDYLIFRSLQSCTNSDIRLRVVSYPVKIYRPIAFVTVYCMNFIIILCITHKFIFSYFRASPHVFVIVTFSTVDSALKQYVPSRRLRSSDCSLLAVPRVHTMLRFSYFCSSCSHHLELSSSSHS